MFDIFAIIHIEGNQAATTPASEKKKHTANEPGQKSSSVSEPCFNILVAMWTRHNRAFGPKSLTVRDIDYSGRSYRWRACCVLVVN